MTWYPDVPDVPDLPMDKPHEIERLEKLAPSIINAMTQVEIDEKIRDAANSIAKEYHRVSKEKGSLDECELIVGVALSQTGNSIAGHLGMAMVGKSDAAAAQACAIFYPKQLTPNELDY